MTWRGPKVVYDGEREIGRVLSSSKPNATTGNMDVGCWETSEKPKRKKKGGEGNISPVRRGRARKVVYDDERESRWVLSSSCVVHERCEAKR